MLFPITHRILSGAWRALKYLHAYEILFYFNKSLSITEINV